jgi:multicomponent Na+:H+ antiporter subunit A
LGRRAALLSSLLPLSAFVTFAFLVPETMERGSLRAAVDWVPSLNIRLSFVLDGLSLLFCLIIFAVGFLISVYAAFYFDAGRDRNRFYGLFYLFMAAMTGLVLAEDLIALFVFWEITTLVSFLLIGFDHESAQARRNARQALLVTGAGGLFLLIAVLLIGDISGTYSIAGITAASIDWPAAPAYPILLFSLLVAAFTKSAQFPFHFWLPNAMSAPTPISAFLHSATMVKAGIYLLARLHPVFGGTAAWMAALVIIGGATALLGSVLALGQKDMKKALAYTTIMALGIITMFLGGQTTPALTAAVTFLLVHALYKSSLFLVVGIIDHETGTRDLDRLGGLLRRLPFTGAGAFAAGLSMAGFPLFLGFIGKEIMYKGALTEDLFPGFATAAAVLSNAMMTAVAAFLTVKPFLQSGGDPHVRTAAHEAPAAMWGGPVILGLTGLVFGIFPDWVGDVLVEPAVTAFHFTTEDIELQLWHGFNLPLLLSVVTLCLGALLFKAEAWVREMETLLGRLIPMNWDRIYDGIMAGVAGIANVQTRWIQNGSLYVYLLVIFSTFIGFCGLSFIYTPLTIPRFFPGEVDAIGLMVALAVLGATVVVASTASRLLAICGLGVVGAGAALFFLISSAPDVALTQLLVETLSLVFVALVLLRLPKLRREDIRFSGRRVVDALVAAAAGLCVAVLVMAVTQGPLDRSLTAFFEAKSLAVAHGRNIVNVILVDFRGLDTLGEITVVAVAGLAGVALVRGRGRT